MINVIKTLAGDEIIGMFMSKDPENGTFNLEYPFLVETDIDKDTKVTYTDLVPYMFGADLSGPFKVAAHTVSILPCEPKDYLKARYKELVEKISAMYEHNAQVNKSAPVYQKPGRRLNGK